MIVRERYTTTELSTLESWRGLLSLLVFIAHLFQIFLYPVIGTNNYLVVINGTIANIAVVCFFLLSGILISYSGFNLVENNKFNWRKYLINRFSRIYPTFIFVLLLCGVFVFVFPYFNGGSYSIQKLDSDKYMPRESYYCSFTEMIRSLLLINSNLTVINGPLWSLIIEWWLYFFGMFLMFFTALEGKSFFFKIVFFFLSLIPLWYNYYYIGVASLYYAAIWLFGFLYSFYFRNRMSLVKGLLYLSAAGVVALVFIYGIKSINIKTSPPSQYGVFQIFLSLLFLNLMFKIKLPSFFNSVARFSYTLYILHFPVALYIFSLSRNLVNNNPVFIFIEICLSLVLIIFASYLIAKVTEEKNIYRNYLYILNEKFTLKKIIQ